MKSAELPASETGNFPVHLSLQGILFTLALCIVAFLVLTPLFLLILNSFQVGRPGGEVVYGLEGWRVALTSPGTVEAIYNTFSLAFVRQLIATVIGIFLAWLLARTDLPLRGTLEFLFWL